MRRRDFLVAAGGACAWARTACAQQRRPTVGLVTGSGRVALRRQIAAFQDGLKEIGHSEGENVTVEYRFAEGHLERLPELIAQLGVSAWTFSLSPPWRGRSQPKRLRRRSRSCSRLALIRSRRDW